MAMLRQVHLFSFIVGEERECNMRRNDFVKGFGGQVVW